MKSLSHGGHTLLEVVVVVLILSMVSAVAIPNFLGWLHQYRLQSAAASLMNHLRAARLLSIFKGVKHEIQVKKSNEGNYYQVVEDPGGSDQVVMSIGRVVLHKRFGEVQLKSGPSTGRIAFFPKGTSTNGSILLENSRGTQIKIVVNNFGRVKRKYL